MTQENTPQILPVCWVKGEYAIKNYGDGPDGSIMVPMPADTPLEELKKKQLELLKASIDNVIDGKIYYLKRLKEMKNK